MVALCQLALPEVAAQRKRYLRLEQELLLSSQKNAPVTERKCIAVEIPITRPNHYIYSDARILVQAYVTSSVVKVSARLTSRKQFLFRRALDLVLYEGYVGRPHHPACPCGRLFCWRHTTSGGGDSATFNRLLEPSQPQLATLVPKACIASSCAARVAVVSA